MSQRVSLGVLPFSTLVTLTKDVYHDAIYEQHQGRGISAHVTFLKAVIREVRERGQWPRFENNVDFMFDDFREWGVL